MAVSMTREQLAQALSDAGRGDRAAFRRVYDATSAKLYGVALRILRDRQLAEDVLQDAYVTIWNKVSTYDPDRASPVTWLATIARNRAIDRLRAAAVRPAGRPLDEAEEVRDETPDAASFLEARQEADRLHVCLDELEARARTAIRTAFFEGVTYEILAERAEVPLGTMKSWIRRGLQKLKACLEP
ncbi:MAG: sigma-70 family RNA polymerase sigma factor [Caulobacterales bacterium]|nr:sigma-70 family RNA polymerase sigma factor [Caulobacterales bacterium]